MDIIKDNTAGLTGLQQLQAIMTAATPPPINTKMGFALVEIEEGGHAAGVFKPHFCHDAVTRARAASSAAAGSAMRSGVSV